MESILKSKSFQFSLDIVRFCELLNSHKQFEISKQLLRSGTSIGANISEAQFAASRADMINKLKISEKEANETAYWIEILRSLQDNESLKSLQEQLLQIKKMLASSIKTLKAKV
jgi:four helix bundle protein